MEVCLSSRIYFSIKHTTLWSSPLINSPIFTPHCPIPNLASLYPLHIWSLPPGSIFFNDAPISHTCQLTTYTPYIFIYSIYVTWMLSYLKPVSTTIPSLNLFCNSSAVWAHQHLGKILKDIFCWFCFLKAVWHLGRYNTEANNIHHH